MPAKKRGEKKSGGRQRSLENLKPWKPGQTGNPGGRPKTAHVIEAIREELGLDGTEGLSNAQLIAQKLVEMAKKGNLNAIAETIDRVIGKARQVMEVTGAGGKDLIPARKLEELTDEELAARREKLLQVINAEKGKK